jgi:hypothetical protein
VTFEALYRFGEIIGAIPIHVRQCNNAGQR